MVIAYNDTIRSESELEKVCETSWLGNTCEELASGSQKIGFQAEVLENLTLESLKDLLIQKMPIIALLDTALLYSGLQGFGHFVVITGLKKNKVHYHDPDMRDNLTIDTQVFFNAWAKFSFKGIKIWKSMKK
jgi:ABC-type bacteriocin/lantibiotic exporter with double-glycine peptidase domain